VANQAQLDKERAEMVIKQSLGSIQDKLKEQMD
jgi:hypothetical protein